MKTACCIVLVRARIQHHKPHAIWGLHMLNLHNLQQQSPTVLPSNPKGSQFVKECLQQESTGASNLTNWANQMNKQVINNTLTEVPEGWRCGEYLTYCKSPPSEEPMGSRERNSAVAMSGHRLLTTDTASRSTMSVAKRVSNWYWYFVTAGTPAVLLNDDHQLQRFYGWNKQAYSWVSSKFGDLLKK